MSNEEIGQRVDVYLLKYLTKKGLTYVSRSFLKNNWEKNFILVNGKSVKPSYKIRGGDELLVLEENVLNGYNDVDFDNIKAQDGTLNIVFEDSNILVLEKEKNMSIHPGISNSENTLANFVRGYLESKGQYDNKVSRAGVVHRLDKGVSGLVVFAKNKETQLFLQEQFQNRNVNKVYFAKLGKENLPEVLKAYLKNTNVQTELNILEKNDFKCDDTWYECIGYISRSKSNRLKMKFSPFLDSKGKKAVSYIKPVSENELLIKIETGRMHQIRATLEYLETYIDGDTLYSSLSGGSIPEKIQLTSILLSFSNIDNTRLVFKLDR